ncbi:DeoR/GlpR family DNA-binding transcription regulator [Actinoallomurus sp. NPDC052274]|uniref:DeoR/GlpR family DNA-binding transcription regulator n=1 Tax=Actinoallomurus sp. NPDC052274 TaxID=3155420 RepID=UPI0034345E1B
MVAPTGDSARRAGRPPYAAQRRQLLLRTLRDTGRIDVTDMADRLAVSTETIRKDLTELERQGLLHRVHGGAVAVEDLSFEPAVGARTEYTDEKRRIGRAALAEVPAEGSVLIDAGSTTSCLAEVMPADRDLAVFTNTLTIAMTLTTRPRLTVHTLGGRIRSRTFAEVDNWAVRALSEIRVDVAFLGTNGFTAEDGLRTPDESEATVKRLMLKAARRRVLLTDHSKLGRISLFKYGDLAEIDLLITDTGMPDADVRRLEDGGVKVIRA